MLFLLQNEDPSKLIEKFYLFVNEIISHDFVKLFDNLYFRTCHIKMKKMFTRELSTLDTLQLKFLLNTKEFSSKQTNKQTNKS